MNDRIAASCPDLEKHVVTVACYSERPCGYCEKRVIRSNFSL